MSAKGIVLQPADFEPASRVAIGRSLSAVRVRVVIGTDVNI